MTQRVLVTGASGLIGAMAVQALNTKGYTVIASCRRGDIAGAAEVIHADLLDETAISPLLESAGASHLVHLAWHAGADRWNGAANQDWAHATRALVRAFAKTGGIRAVCAGSCAEYDWSGAVLAEDTPLKPRTAYGQAKAETGQALCATAPDMGLSLAWARVFFCYGPGEPKGRLLGDLLNGLTRCQPVPCTDGKQARDFLHTADVGAALAAVLDSDLQGAVNIGSGQATPVRDLIETAAHIVGRPDLVRLGAVARAADDPPKLVAQIDRLKSTGFRPQFDLKSGIQNCVDLWKPTI